MSIFNFYFLFLFFTYLKLLEKEHNMDITVEISTTLFKRLLLPEATLLLGMVYFKLHGQDRVLYKRSMYNLTVTTLNGVSDTTVLLLTKIDMEIPSYERVQRAKVRYLTNLLETIPLRLDRHRIDGSMLPSRTITGNDIEILTYIGKGYRYDSEEEILYIVTDSSVKNIIALTKVLRRSRGRWVTKMCESIGYIKPLTVSDTITE